MSIRNDIKYAMRLLAKKPSFSALTVFVMATGIGLSVYLFSFMNTMLFKPLPFEDGEHIIEITTSINGKRHFGEFNLHDFAQVKANLTSVSEFSAYRNETVSVSGRDGARRYSATDARANIFSLTRTAPILGRTFSTEEDKVGGENVAVIGYDLWQNQFAGQADVLSQSIKINGLNHRVIGVMPEGYYFPRRAQLWRPLRDNTEQVTREQNSLVTGLALRKPGVSIEQIDQELNLIMQRLAERYPKTNSGLSAYALTMHMSTADGGMPVVYVMHLAAVLILVLASVNVGNLLLSRAVERSQETAIRVALGAPTGRLLSQLLWESIFICGLGGLIGLLVMGWGLEVTQTVTNQFFTDRPPFWWDFGIDAYTLKIFFAFLVGTIFVTGFLPAWRNINGDFNAVLRDGTRGALGKNAGKLNKALVVGEVFLSITILIVAAVMITASFKATYADYGVNTSNKLIGQIALPQESYATDEQKVQFVQALKTKLSTQNALHDTVVMSRLPGFSDQRPAIAVATQEYSQQNLSSYPRANQIAVLPGSLSNLDAQLVEGRFFSDSDNKAENHTVIVTDSFVEQYMTTTQPIGQRIQFISENGTKGPWFTIVGVIKHIVQNMPNRDKEIKMPSVYLPFAQAPRSSLFVAANINSDMASAKMALTKAVNDIAPELPIFDVGSLDERLSQRVAPLRFVGGVLMLFGLASFLLAASGIYGVMANTISQRTQEIGVKRALGASEQRITAEFIASGTKQLLLGAVPGLAIGLALGYTMSVPIGVEFMDVAIAAVILTLLLSAVVLLATYLPTKRALVNEPAYALHNQ
ncbi:ABC transporter permease [Pseudoalteromonas sp. S16_S37]|uniref:ABC transporter permease n=1 Tax=Pseudoalteromonas sp. S16_S37 TaxID=2720228 RepID=UPI0016803968|nr:ABC transporter permease [Pseudoalteromonas sp. S16_S37]MBD1581962.1 FtsX-like permease family protein [Pseudoalteromonas sp. S16_S37]